MEQKITVNDMRNKRDMKNKNKIHKISVFLFLLNVCAKNLFKKQSDFKSHGEKN